jgi:hypothetical protein
VTADRWRWWQGIAAATAVALFVPRHAEPQFTSAKAGSRHILEGRWQSCPEGDGQFSERVYDHVVNGVGRFEVHLGPGREFAIFQGVQANHQDHQSDQNLLRPHEVLASGNRASQAWSVPALGVAFSVSMAGEPQPGCESWFIVLTPLDKTSQ